VLGRDGIEQVVELPLDDAERSGFEASIESIRAELENL
jgi:malate/lactate dehydrogenase